MQVQLTSSVVGVLARNMTILFIYEFLGGFESWFLVPLVLGLFFPFLPIFVDHCYLFQMFILEPSLLASPYQGQWFFGQLNSKGHMKVTP